MSGGGERAVRCGGIGATLALLFAPGCSLSLGLDELDSAPAGGAAQSSGAAGAASSNGQEGSGGAPGATTNQWVLGYYVGYQIDDYPIASIDWSALTHIAFGPMTVKPDLGLDLGFDDAHGTGVVDAKALAAAAHAHGVKALLMLGGEGAGATIATAAGGPHRAVFVKALLEAVSTLGYDGIDLAWQDDVNLADLVSLAQDLRAAQPGLVLSYPGESVNANIQSVDPLMATLAASLDRFNVQTYYPSNPFAGSGWDSWFGSPITGASGTTPYAIDDSLSRYVAAGIPKEKLGMGLGFHALCYTGGISGPHQPTNGTSQQIVGGDGKYPLSAFFASGGTFDQSQASEQRVDDVARVPYLSLASPVMDARCGAGTRYITYDDETSIVAKGTFSRQHGYGGVIVWTIQQGWLPANASGGRARGALMQALKKGFLDP